MVTREESLHGETGLVNLALRDINESEPISLIEGDSVPDTAGCARWIAKTADICLGFSMYALYPVILIVICVDVAGRNFFGMPLSWAIEGSGLFLIGAIFLAAPMVELDKGHILLDILYANYQPRMKNFCDMLTRCFAFLWMLAATVRSSLEIPTAYMLNESGADFRYPFWPMRVIMTIGFLVLTLVLLHNVFDACKQFLKGGQK